MRFVPVLAGITGIVFLLYIVLFTSPIKGQKFASSASSVRILGDVERVKSFWSSKGKGNGTGIAVIGPGDELCPEPGCAIPEKEHMTLELTGGEITELIKTFKTDSILLSDVQIRFEGETAFGKAVSKYPFLPGLVSVESHVLNQSRFTVDKAYVGQIPVPSKLYARMEDGINMLIFDYLNDLWIDVNAVNIKEGKVVVVADLPKGLVKVENGVLVVNSDLLNSKKSSSGGNGKNGDFRIMNRF